MTIASTVNRFDFVGNGATSVYGFPNMKIFSATDLKVTKRDTSNEETVLVVNTDYTVSGVGATVGGSITLTAGNLPSNYKLTIRRVRPLTQGTDIRNQGDFFPEIHEDALDDLTMKDQTQQFDLDRSLKLKETVTGVSAELPLPVIGKAIGWNSSANGLTNLEGVPVTANFLEEHNADGTHANLPWVDVRAYGAVGDGVADDTTALLNWAAASAGKVVYLAKGTYKTNGTVIPFSANTQVIGAGHALSKIKTTSTHVNGVISLAAGCSLKGITVDGSTAAGKIVYATGSYVTISGNRIIGTGSNGFGIHAYNAASILIEDNEVEATSGTPNHQIYVSTGSNVRIHKNRVKMNQQMGGSATIRVTSSNYITISDNHAEGGNVSVVQTPISGDAQEPNSSGTPSNYINIVGNNVLNSSGDGVSVGSNPASAATYNVVLANNSVTGSTDYGMSVTNCDNFAVIGNTVMSVSTTGIGILDGTNGVIMGNTSMNNGQNNFVEDGGVGAGINVLSGSTNSVHNVTISGNTCTDLQGTKTQKYGIYVNGYGYTAQSNINISNNVLVGNATGSIQFATTPTALTISANQGSTAIKNRFGEGEWIGIGADAITGLHLKGPSPTHAGVTLENTFASDKVAWKQYNNGDTGLEVFTGGATPIYMSLSSGEVLVDKLRTSTQTPATAGATGTTGRIVWDPGYIYVCVATNTWKRSALTTW